MKKFFALMVVFAALIAVGCAQEGGDTMPPPAEDQATPADETTETPADEGTGETP